MSRLLSHVAAFGVAAAAAYAGLADASDARAVPSPLTVETADPVLPTAGDASAETPDDWSRRIEARLAALGRQGASTGMLADSGAADDPVLAGRLESLVHRAGPGARVAVHVRDLATGATVFDDDGARLLNPASNQKILTSVAAVELLGTDYQFETRLARAGDTLYLIGGGDPTLHVPDLYDLAQAAHESGVMDGISRIVVDDSAFTPRRFGPGYDPEGPGVSYMAPSGALSLTFNTIEVTVRPGPYGEPVEVTYRPETPHVRVDVAAMTGAGRRLSIDTFEDGGHTVLRVGGSLPAGHGAVRMRRRIHDPGLFTGGVFARLLAEIGGNRALGVTRGRAPATAQTIATHHSVALPDALDAALKYSNNFCTEQVLRTLGWRATGAPGSWQNGTATVARFWDALDATHEDALVFVNGSGLSREGRATPRALVDLVARTQREGSPAASLLSTLAGAGTEGTLRLRLAHAEGRVRAKTGTLNGVSALSGVAISEDGRRRLGFSILINGGVAAHSRSVQDRMVFAMLGALDREAPAASE